MERGLPICSVHDLASVFERVFGIKPKDLQKNKKLVKVPSTNWLDLKKDVVLLGRGTKEKAGKTGGINTQLESRQE